MDCVKEKEFIEAQKIIQKLGFQKDMFISYTETRNAIIEGIKQGKEIGKQEVLVELGKTTQSNLKLLTDKTIVSGRKQLAEEIQNKAICKHNYHTTKVICQRNPQSCDYWIKLEDLEKLQKEIKK